MNVYEIEAEHVDYNNDDFVEYFWLTPQQVIDKLKKGDKSKDDLPLLVKIFYLKK
ncbi:MAG TPA: hypothetical protein VJJ21_00520 [Candidatus Nanoarchaeia archaeon]|nr:hypothetical protein [Candidatus Nanoarchaeia archaeon]